MSEKVKKAVLLTEDECATIMVGLSEFDDIIHTKKSGCFDVYKPLVNPLVDKFREICWQFHWENQPEKTLFPKKDMGMS